MEKRAWEDDYEMEPEYDFSDGVPNPYAAKFLKGGSVVVLEPDVAAVFPDSEAVNQALRKLMQSDGTPEFSKAS
jgi:hypothetical protein